MKLKERKQMIKLYWEWKLRHTSLLRLVEREKISVYDLKQIFEKFDYEFELENWTAKYI